MSLTKLLPVTVLSAGVLFGTGCRLDVNGQAYIEREQKRFPVDGVATVADLDLKTFSGRIEVISWDRPEVLVEIEKRGEDKDAVSKITVTSEQKASKISIDVRHPGRTSFVGIGHFTSPSAKLIVSVPRKCNITARSGDGSIALERVEGSLDLRTDEGTIRVIESRGQLLAESRDGSMTLDDVSGHVEARTSDGTVRVSGTPSVLRIRSGDGSVSLRIRDGATMTDDWMVTTNDGSVTAELPKDFSAMIEADPGSDGRVRSELVLSNVTGAGSDSRRRERGAMSGQLGAGGKRFTLRTGDGTIRLTNY
jgi:DUF4097 and DUF4098 domain-containing protein YvlB